MDFDKCFNNLHYRNDFNMLLSHKQKTRTAPLLLTICKCQLKSGSRCKYDAQSYNSPRRKPFKDIFIYKIYLDMIPKILSIIAKYSHWIT